MNVLSLFDGISCGMVALERAGIPVERYVSYEIDENAIKISKKNYSNIERHGDVFGSDFKVYKGFDLLIGGYPCTYWSISQHNGRETTPDGIGGELFMQYVRALKESGCKYFIYENNNSISNEIKEFISDQLGVHPIMINSALLSAQNRKRCYWTNIPNVKMPEDRGIVVDDILETHGQVWPCAMRGRYDTYTNGRINQHIEVRKDRKTNTVTTVQKDSMIIGPKQIGHVSVSNSQGNRVYSVKGKSVTLNANGGAGGEKTGLYKIDLPDGDYVVRNLTITEAERLQTLPDGYTDAGVSKTARYKGVGNGWTVDVIAHIMKGLKDKEVEE